MIEPDFSLAIALGLSLAAGLMRGFAGFGSGMMLSPILAILYGPAEAVLMIAVMEIVVSVQLVPKALPDAQWPFLGPLILAAIIGMPLGAWLLATTEPELIARFIAGIVMVFVIVLAVGWRYQGPKRLLPTLGVGGVSGALLTATSVGGPPVLLYILSGQDSARTNRANIILYFAIAEIITPIFLYLQDLFALEVVIRALALCPAYMVGAWVGSRLFRESSEQIYRRVALIFLSMIALYGILH
ncbi:MULTISPECIES: sulfite exporter TauE/SafE family protein [unclassified Minwuia]|uniref:sulfite exporter TauE/SafE family protein n=1 Tax=unclassified Minwuia TaxID=2618799 RepID=UPI002478EE11|nr:MULTISPECIES: sulfite exporter TauE/SafE family protein [unclassified Minwuia]